MDLGYEGRASMHHRKEDAANIRVSLNLKAVGGIDDPKRIGEELPAKREMIREQIFRVTAEKIVPELATGGSMLVKQPKIWRVESNSNYASRLEAPTTAGGNFSSQHHLDMDVNFFADQAMDPATMMYLGRHQIAAIVADACVFDLEHRYLGKQNAVVSSMSSMEGDRVVSYRAGENENRPMADDSETYVPYDPFRGKEFSGGESEFNESSPEVPDADGSGAQAFERERPVSRERGMRGEASDEGIPEIYRTIDKALSRVRDYADTHILFLPMEVGDVTDPRLRRILSGVRDELAKNLKAKWRFGYDWEKVAALIDIDTALAAIDDAEREVGGQKSPFSPGSRSR